MQKSKQDKRTTGTNTLKGGVHRGGTHKGGVHKGGAHTQQPQHRTSSKACLNREVASVMARPSLPMIRRRCCLRIMLFTTAMWGMRRAWKQPEKEE